MKNRILYALLAFLLFPTGSGVAQVRLRETLQDGKTLIMLTPQYLGINQLRIEVDRKMAPQHWMTFAPHYVQNLQPYQTHSGFGLVATYKFLFAGSFYVGGGAQFTHHMLNNYTKDDLYTDADLWLYKTNVTQYGMNAVLGRYIKLYSYLFGDIYGGIGYRFSGARSSDELEHPSGVGFLGYDYVGLTCVVGIRLGIML